jgi:rod shape-determining protein MreD
MRQNSVWAAMVIAAALLEATWPQALSLQRVVPDLIVVLVVYFSIAEGAERGMYTGVLGGMFQDVAGNTGIGHHILCLVIIAYVVGRMASRLITENPYVKTVTVLLASMVHGILYLAVEYVQKVDMNALKMMSFSIVPQACFTALLTPFVFLLVSRLRSTPIQGT